MARRIINSGPPVLGQKPTLIVSWFCPFAQRTWIAAEAKKAPYQLHEISYEDLYNKPAWFTDLNAAGLIPVLAWEEDGIEQHQRRIVTESLICNEYLEEAYPAAAGRPALMPACPYERAQARHLIEQFSKAVPEFYRMLVRQDPSQQAAAAAAFTQVLQSWLQHIHPTGPLALGQQLSLVDCAAAPFLLRLPVLEHYRQYKASERLGTTEAARLQAYLDAMAAVPEVQATQVHPEGKDYAAELLGIYQRYADGSAGSLMARDAKKD